MAQAQVNNRSGQDTTIFISNTVFMPKYSYESGVENWGVDVADFNGDGFIDIVSCSQKDNKVNVHLNNGIGKFPSRYSYSCGNSPRDVVVGDFNKDKAPDFAVVGTGDGALTWMLNDGKGRFYEKKSIKTGPNPHMCSAGTSIWMAIWTSLPLRTATEC